MDISVDVILYICGAITAIAAASAIVSKRFKKSVVDATKESIHEEMQKYQKEVDVKIEKLNQQLQEFIKLQTDSNEQTRKSLLASTRDRINQAHNYHINNECIGDHSLFVLEELYTSYKQLGGNSFIDQQMEELRELEVRSGDYKRVK